VVRASKHIGNADFGSKVDRIAPEISIFVSH
jgi:hypothetical protein